MLFRYKVIGRDKLREFKNKTGVVVVCNHTSFLDVAFIYLAGRPSQWVRLIGRDSLFDNAKGLSDRYCREWARYLSNAIPPTE